MSTVKSCKTCLMNVYLQVTLCDVGYRHYPLCMCACVWVWVWVCECVWVWVWVCVCVCVCVCVWFSLRTCIKTVLLWFSQHCGWRWQSFGYDTVLIVNSLTTIRRSLLYQSSGYSNNTDLSNTLKMEECPLKSR